jgi:hypothetical protein
MAVPHLALVPRLCMDIVENRIYWSEHLTLRVIERPTPARSDVHFAVCDDDPIVIEHYPHDPRGASCLIRGMAGSRALHVCYAYDPDAPVVITSYWPDTQSHLWDNEFRRRVPRS